MRKYLVLLLVAAVALIAVPAMAQAPAPAPEKTVTLFAEVWFQAWYDQYDKDNSKAMTDKNGKKVESYRALSWGVDETVTRFGARFKQGNMAGAVVLNTSTNYAGGQHYREWWGEYDFGMFKFFFGHAYTITYQPAYMQARGGQNGFAGSTTFTANREDHMKVTVPLGVAGTVALAGVEPYSSKNNLGASGTFNFPTVVGSPAAQAAITGYTVQYKMPKIEALYNYVLKTDAFLVDAKVFGGYQEVDYYITGTNAKAFTMKSMAYGANAKVVAGPATVQASLGKLTNGREYGAGGPSGGDILYGAYYNFATKKMDDTDTLQAHVAAGFKVDMFTPQIGYGMNKGSMTRTNNGGAKTELERTQSEIYVNVLIQPNAFLTINPEFCLEKLGKEKSTTGGVSTTTKKGSQKYYGAEFIYRF